MRALSSADVLGLWEQGVSLHPLDRGLLALGMADPAAANVVADWPLGRRNHALLELHTSWFGPRLGGWTSCPACGEKVEFELDARQLAAPSDAWHPQESVNVGEHAFRLPTSRDLAHVAAADDGAPASIGLLERCRIGGPQNREWTSEMLEAIEDRLVSADPLAEIRLALSCPSCGRGWDDTLNIERFLWAEVEALARRVLWEVHTLASAYGWSESETLALSAARRTMYLQMVHS
jgi:hypothetical protein